MYICKECGCKFEEPREIETTYESYYGISDEVYSRTSITLHVCPNCDSEEIRKEEEIDE